MVRMQCYEGFIMTLTRYLIGSATALTLAFSAMACDGTGADAAEDGGAGGETGSATGGSATGGSATGGSATGGSDTGTGGSDSTCLADSDEFSGSSTVVWDDGDVAEGLTATFDEDGMLVPANLTVPVNERFGIENPAGTGIKAIKIGCAGAQTIPAGFTAGFIINEPGTYEIFDETANDYVGAQVGTVTVE